VCNFNFLDDVICIRTF